MDDVDLTTTLRQVCRAAPAMARLTAGVRATVLEDMAKALAGHMDEILEANTLDLEGVRGQLLPDWVAEGLKLTPERLQQAAHRLQTLARLPDPLGVVDRQTRLERRLTVQRYRLPLGVVGVVYEVFVEAGIQGVGMACKTGNGVVSAAAQELSHTHQAVMGVLSMAAYEAGIPEGAIQVLPSASIWEGGWLRQHRYMDLIVAYGRGNWCERLRETSSVPLLEAQIGQGALYIDEDAPWSLVKTVLLDKPDILTRLPELWVVLHQAWAEQYLRDFLYSVVDREYPVQVEDDIMQHFPGLPPVPSLVDSSQGSSLRIRVVPSLTEAIAWINKHSHRQLEIIFTNTLTTSQRFIQEVDSAIIYLNAFPAVQGSDPLGVAAPKLPTRGWIDLNALTTTKTLVHPLY